MPIANCFFTSHPDDSQAEAIIGAWSTHSGVDADEMTVNVLHALQGGKRYEVMAWLYLPSLWSEDDVVALSEGLAAALVDVTELPASSIQVLTSIVSSGMVIEAGRTVRW